MWKLIAPRRRHVILFCLVSFLVFGAVYLHATTNEAFEFGSHFVAEDARVVKLTGSQRAQRLLFWRGFSYSFGDGDGEASMTLRVIGERGTFDVPVVLKKRQGKWGVVGAQLIDERGDRVVVE